MESKKRELENIYFGMFERGEWVVNKTYAYLNTMNDRVLGEMDKLEQEIYGERVNNRNILKNELFINARKRWAELQNSPLMKALS